MSAPYKASILIVDDRPTNLFVLGKILRPEKYKTFFASNGAKALELAREEFPDLILLDIMMPQMDGFEVCQRLKKNPLTQKIPIIFISAIHEISEKVKGFNIGGVDFITKPIQPREVIARVDVHLGLKRSQEELTSAIAAKDKLLSIIGHDLRGPLGSIIQATDMLIKFDDIIEPHKRLKIIKELHKGAKRTYDLLENTLFWAYSQRGDILHQATHLRLKVVVDETIEALADLAQEKKIRLHTDIPEELSVYADKNMLVIVLRNLISNALKFTPQAGEVKVTARDLEAFVEVAVIDNGVGVSAKNQKRLFDLDNHFTTLGTHNEKGSGLGLLLCKEFVEKNGGEIGMENIKSGGSMFKFTVPQGSFK